MDSYHPLPDFVALAVPLKIAEYRRRGGPTEADFERCRDYATRLGEHGDALLYRVKGQTAEMANLLVDGLAVLAFVPGGVTVFGQHFEEIADGS